MSMLRDKYKKEVVAALLATQRFPTVMDVPRVSKVVINIGVNALVDRDTLKRAVEDLAKITGQRAIIIKATKSVSNFKLREGMEIGAKVTLRGERMYEFLERLIHSTLPRIRDFRGVPLKSFDGHGNYSLGLKEQTLFPEIEADKVKRVQGMDITIVTTAKTNEDAKELLKLLGMPFAIP